MHLQEAGGFFATDRLRPTDGADPNAFKVRRGKVGGYRDYFDPSQVAAIDRLVAERLAPELGYGPAGSRGTPARS